MGFAAVFTDNTADAETEFFRVLFDVTVVITVNGEPAGVTTGAA